MEQWLTPSLIIALLALGVSVVNAAYLRKRDQQKDWKDDNQKLHTSVDDACDRIDDVEGDVKVLKKQMDLFWKTVEQQMARKFGDGD